MKKSKLTKSQIKDLIEDYKSEVEKLNYRLANVKETLKSLRADLKTAPDDTKPATKKTTAKKPGRPKKAATAEKATAKKPGRPKKAATAEKATAKKPGRPKKAATAEKATATKTGAKDKRGRKPIVTAWDKFVKEAIEEAKKALHSAALFEAVKKKAQAAKLYDNDAKVKARINATLQKLVNRKKELAKFKHTGRGYAYGLPSWGKGGKLKAEYKA